MKVLENFKQSLQDKATQKHGEYQELVEEAKKKRSEMVEGFQEQIKQIQEQVESSGNLKMNRQQENEMLKQKMVEVKEHIDKRDKLLEDEWLKQENDRKEREEKIESQMSNISQTMGGGDNVESKLEEIKKEEELVDIHFQPYLNKTDEFHNTIEATNSTFEIYKNNMEQV